MLYPALGPQYLGEPHKDILKYYETCYAEAITINQSFWAEADLDLRFLVNDQTLWSDVYGNLPATRRRQFNFNHIKPIVNMIGGHQRKNRKSIICTPIENGDNETADQFTKVLMWAVRRDNMLETISEAFHGSLTTGMNLLQVWIDYRDDPVSGNIKLTNRPYSQYIADPYFKKSDMSDCNYITTRTFLSKREVMSLLPDQVDIIMALNPDDSGNSRDGKFQFTPESYSWSQAHLLTYDEFYYRAYRTQKLLVDSETGESMEWRHDDEDALKQFMQAYPMVTLVEQEVPTTRLAIIVQGRVLYDGPNPLGIDQYPFVPVFAYFEPSCVYFPYKIQGVVRALRDSQYLYNRKLIISLDILEATINSGWKYKENALVNPADVFLQGQGKGLALKEHAQMTDVEKIEPSNLPPSHGEILKTLGEEMLKISGVNEELMGSAVDDKAGILSMLRQGAGLTGLQSLFDNLDFAQKMIGQIMIDVIQANFTPGKIKKILEGEEPTAQFYQKAFGKYGAAVEDGLNTTTQKQMQFAQLLQMRELGLPIPDDILIDAATITNKKDLLDAIKAGQEQQQQAMQQQNQAQQAQTEALIRSMHAKATADEKLGVERESKSYQNIASANERVAEAVKNEEVGMLNVIKALKEIDQIDIDQIYKLVELQQMLHQNEEARKQQMQPQQPQPQAQPEQQPVQ